MSILDRKRSSSHAKRLEGHVIRYHLACHVQPSILNSLVFQIFFLKTTQSIVVFFIDKREQFVVLLHPFNSVDT